MDMLCHRQLEFLQKMNELDFIKQLREDAAAQEQTEAPRAAAPEQEAPEIQETVKSIGETVARVMDEPVVNVRPDLRPSVVEDERPTKSFNIITDPEDAIDRSYPVG